MRFFIFIFLTAFFLPKYLCSQKTDHVFLKNGDIFTGEVKRLDLDILLLKTDALGTVEIEWRYVSNIFAPGKSFEIELRDKTLLFGSLDTTNLTESLRIVGPFCDFVIPVSEVITIVQVKRLFINRFSGNFGAGLSYTKASEVTQFNYNANITYTDLSRYATMDISAIETRQSELPTTSKQDINLAYNHMTSARQFIIVFGGLQENTELGVGLREMAGIGYGLDLLHNNVSRWRITSSILTHQEATLEAEVVRNNGEFLFGMEGRIFKYRAPEIYLTTKFNWFPSFTVIGRNRFEAEVKLSFEIINNLFFELNFYDNYDSHPLSETASTNDFGIITSFKYNFGL